MPASLTASQDRAPLLGLALWAEYAAVFLCLIMFSEGLLPRFFASEVNPESTVLRLMWLPVYGLVAAGCIWKAKKLFQLAIRMPFLVILLGLSVASLAWSINPEVTERRAIAGAGPGIVLQYWFRPGECSWSSGQWSAMASNKRITGVFMQCYCCHGGIVADINRAA